MNIYDTVNKLAQEIKESEEYINYKMAKQALDLNSELKIKIKVSKTALLITLTVKVEIL